MGIPANLFPHYSVHAIGFQANFIAPAKALSFFLPSNNAIDLRVEYFF